MNTTSRTTRRNIFCSRVFLAFLLVSLIVQIMLFMFQDDYWELFSRSLERAFRRARYGKP